jgi:hypothetical protein
MYCKKCRFHSFDHVDACPKCGAGWEETRKSLYLNWITASGVNWVASLKEVKEPPRAETAKAASAPEDELSDLIAATPAAPAPKTEDIDVSIFPELDFSMEDAKPQTPTPAPKTAAARQEELFLDAMPVDDTVELDFSSSFEEPAAPTPPPLSKPKREDLFIPELEEMLAPLTDEPRQNPAPAKKQVMSEESEILLDFGNDSPQKGASSDADDVPFLDLDETKKSS